MPGIEREMEDNTERDPRQKNCVVEINLRMLERWFREWVIANFRPKRSFIRNYSQFYSFLVGFSLPEYSSLFCRAPFEPFAIACFARLFSDGDGCMLISRKTDPKHPRSQKDQSDDAVAAAELSEEGGFGHERGIINDSFSPTTSTY